MDKGDKKESHIQNKYEAGWHYYVQDYMGNTRMVINLDGTVEQETHYYPYGGVIGDLSTDENLQPYKFEGKELDRTFGLDWYDIQARQYDAIGIPGWNAVDPLAEKYYGNSPYAYCAGNPVNYVDYDGCSTLVTYDTISQVYNVVDGNLEDSDMSIYLCYYDEDGKLVNTHASIGESIAITSFYDSDKEKWKGVIDPNDNSGIDFLDDFYNNTPGLIEYISNASNSTIDYYQRYDFKVTNGKRENLDASQFNRGLRIKNGLYASARDIGNICAGAIAKKYNIPWPLARLIFDGFQSRKSLKYYPPTNVHSLGGISFSKWTPEGPQSQNAQKYGYDHYKQFVQ